MFADKIAGADNAQAPAEQNQQQILTGAADNSGSGFPTGPGNKYFNAQQLNMNPNQSLAAASSSQESSLAGQGLLTYNKTILVNPDELTFDQVVVNQVQQQVLSMQNTLSAPVEITLKSSNWERLELAPRQLRLAPHEQCQVTATFRQPRPFPAKTKQQKETIFIKSDFFDQKITVTILPASNSASSLTSESANSSLQRAGPSNIGARGAAFQQATSTMSRQQLATTTIGKTSGMQRQHDFNPNSEFNAIDSDLGANDSFGRATTDDMFLRPSEKRQGQPQSQPVAQAKVLPSGDERAREFDPAIQQSEMVEVTMAADSKADIVSGAHFIPQLGGGLADATRDQEMVFAQKRQFESHETSLMRQQLNEIRQQNENLKVQLAEALASSTNQQQTEGNSLEQIKALLREREPKLEELLTEAMKHERANQKRKDAKVLEILQFKDQQIGEMTQALADHKVLKAALQESSEKLERVESELGEAYTRLKLVDSNEEKFQDLIRSQSKIEEQSSSISALELQLTQLRAQVEQGNQARIFLEEACERGKTQLTLIQAKLDASEADLLEERSKNSSLEDQIGDLRMQLDRMMEQSLARKDSEANQAVQDRNQQQIQRFELENAQLQEKIFNMQDVMQQVFNTLGKVTGGEQINNGLLGSDSASTENNAEVIAPSLDEQNGFDEQRLAQRAEEIVLIVEQVQTQYTILEKEMRSLVNKASSKAIAVQTDLKSTEIDDMHGHFAALQAQLRERQQERNTQTEQLLEQLQDAMKEIDRLNQALRNNGAKAVNSSALQQHQLFCSSNDNLLTTNRHSSQTDLKEAAIELTGTAEILVSERGDHLGGGIGQPQSNLGASGFSANTAGPIQNHHPSRLSATTSQGMLPGGGPSKQVAEMQEREHQLLDQLSILKEQLRFQTSHSEVNTLGGDPTAFAQEHLNLRIGELETLVFQQREQILSLQDHSSNLQRQLEDKLEENRHKLELYEVRNHNLQELNQKYQEAAKLPAATGYDATQYVHTFASGGGSPSLSPPMQASETEKVKQYAQQQEMRLMDLQHALKEAQISLRHALKAKEDLQGKLLKSEHEHNRLQQDSLLKQAGVNIQDSKLALLVQELKNRIKRMEKDSMMAPSSYGGHTQKQGAQSDGGPAQAPGNLGQASTLYALREEYCTKLEKLVEANAEERSEAQGQLMLIKQKNEAQTAQNKQMEEKEMRLFSQVEDLRSQHALDEEQWKIRVKDLTAVLEAKKQVCNDLEREVKQKEKMLAERQEQLSILLSAMEQQNGLAQSSGDPVVDGSIIQLSPLEDAKQRLSNMAAELCSLKAVEAQMERRCADMAHTETQALQKIQKLEQNLADSQVKTAMLTRKVQTLESSNELLERQRHDLGNRTEEIERERSDYQYKIERLQFQLKTKEETIACLKSQSIQAETHFKEQVDRIRDDLVMQQQSNFVATLGRNRDYQTSSIDTENQQQNQCQMAGHRPRREVALKIAIQQLHLVIADYIERASSDQVPTSMEEAQKNIIQEMEKALGVAQTTIQRLEGDLDRERHKNVQLTNEWDALALNGILITRQERMAAQLKTISKLLTDRDTQQVQASREQSDALNRIVREQETKLDGQAKLVAELDQEAQGLKLANKRLTGENEELQANMMCYSQEQAAIQASMEKKAQISVDERHRQRTEALKIYFDDTVAKLLIGSGNDTEKVQVMGRELAALQLLVDRQRRDLDVIQSERDGLINNLRFYKSQYEDIESKHRDLQNKAHQDQIKLESFESGANRKVQTDKRKQECLNLEKELIRCREAGELKAREVTNLLQRIESHKFDDMQNQLGKDLQRIAEKKRDSATSGALDEHTNYKIQQLQEQLMEIRGCHIQELEELRVQSDLEVAEARRELSQQRQQFESKFMPGTAPGEILDQNHELRERVAKLQVEVDHLLQEGDGMRNQLFDQNQQNELLQAELQEREQLLNELETTVITQQVSQPAQSAPIKSALKRGSSQGRSTPIEAGQVDHYSNRNTEKFMVTPPVIIRELFSAKKAEILAKQRLRVQLQTEVKLRQQLTSNLADELHQQRINEQQMQLESATFVIGEEIVNQLMAQNANILGILQDGNSCNLDTTATAVPQNVNTSTAAAVENQTVAAIGQSNKVTLAADFELLVRALIYFADQQAFQSSTQSANNQNVQPNILQQESLQVVNEAQRIVIRALTQRHQADRIKYGPEREVDRKVWYLELLEEQVADAEGQTTKLSEFVKRLQIGVSGSLHSAAEIKASSMDLASHLKQASEEIKTLRNVAGLIKHDVLNLQSAGTVNNTGAAAHDTSSVTASQADFNPFLTGRNQQHTASKMTTLDPGMELQTAHLQQTQRSNMERLLNEHESMHNQLNLTSKIKQSLETELVQSKLAHASELQQVIQKMSTAEKRLHEMGQARSQLLSEQKEHEEQARRQESEIASLQKQLVEMESTVQSSKLAAAKARDSSKNWQKMQTDMQDWRRSNEESLKAKQRQLQEAQDRLSKIKGDKKRLKAENEMLRRSQREARDVTSMENLRQENTQLVAKFNEQLDERKREIEFWVQERAQMRDKIDQLESGAAGQITAIAPSELFNSANGRNDEQVEKLQRKLKTKETKLKQMKSDLLEQKNQVSKFELNQVKMEAQIREAQTNLAGSQDQLNLAQNRTRELEIERDLLMARQKDAMKVADADQVQVGVELDKLQGDFAKLKVQRDTLEAETKGAAERERAWRDQIDKLNRDLVSMQNCLTTKETETGEALSLHEKKKVALLSDLKFMRDENQKLHEKLREANEGIILMEQQLAQANQAQAELQMATDSLKHRVDDQGGESRAKDLKIAEFQATLQANETAHFHKIKSLQSTLAEVKQESGQTAQLLQTQLETLKTRLQADKKVSVKEIDQTLAITQKDTLLKHAKKDLATSKAQVAKLKAKNKELKQHLDQIPQREAPNSSNQAHISQPSRYQQKKNQTQIAQQNIAPAKAVNLQTELATRLSEVQGLQKLLKTSKQVNELEARISEGQLELTKVENWNYALQQQLDEAKSTLELAEGKINDLIREKKDLQKSKQQAISNSERALKDQVKQLTTDNDRLREEWSSPQNVAVHLETIQQLQTQVKQQQAELSRKAKHLGQVKIQKEQTSKEQSQVQGELATLTAENSKLKTQLKEAMKSEKMCRDFRGQVDWLTKSEKRLKEEILSLNEKLKGVRAELTRKDQHLRDYKDRMDMIQSEVTGRGDLEGEVSRLKDQNRRHKVDLEVKDNQVKTLRNRLEQNYSEIQALSEAKSSLAQQDSEMGAKFRTQKQKTKRYEANLLKSVTVLKKIGVELAALQHQKSSIQSARFGEERPLQEPGSPSNRRPIQVYRNDSSAQGLAGQGASGRRGDGPMDVDDLAKDAAYYKDSVEILGLSMNEMESFINPAAAAQNARGPATAQRYSPPSSLISSSGAPVTKNPSNSALLDRLERLDQVQGRDLGSLGGHDIEEIGEYCVSLINGMNSQL